MLGVRVIPCLLLRNQGLVKTIRFGDPTYLGDPINIVKIFNEKEVDELILLDITATVEKKRPNLELLSAIASEAFVPLGYGGGVRTLDAVKELLCLGFEKVIINSYAVQNPQFIRQAAEEFGSQSIVVSMDVRQSAFGRYEIFTHGGRKRTEIDPVTFAEQMERLGAGEILVNSIDRDGTMLGYDLNLLKRITAIVGIPVIACGGAGKIDDFWEAVHKGGVSAVAAGSMFVFQGRHRAVLITFPTAVELENTFPERKMNYTRS